MADLMLNKPAAGQQTVLTDLAENNRLVLGFSPADASMERAGDNLVFTFDDGSSLVLENFYTAYSGETIPDFEVDGAELSGADFFAALDSDLMPAAGPAAGPNAARNAAYRTWDTADLMDGVDRLGGLDLGWNGEPEIDETLNGFPRGDDVNFAPTVSIGGVVTLVEAGVFVGGNEAKAGVPTASGQVAAYDANGDALSFGFLGPDGQITGSITTEYGVISIGPDGTFTYTLNNEAANGLAEGQVVPENFTVVVTDSRGASSTATITVNVTGSNDVPTLVLGRDGVPGDGGLTVSDDGANVVEGAITDSGMALGDDPDAGHDLQYSFGNDADGHPITSITDQYGTLTIDPDTGEYTYTLDKDSEAVQKLTGRGDDVTQHVTVVVTDEYGAHAERPLDITIKGANDLPIITEVSKGDVADVVEAGVLVGGNDPTAGTPTATGQIIATDIDGDTLNFAVLDADGHPQSSVTTPYGTITIGSDGTYTYTLNNDAANSLAEGETQQETFTVQVSDGRGGTVDTTITVNITGTNDIPSLELGKAHLTVGDDGANVVEGTITDGGTALGDDPDAGHDLRYSFGSDADGNPITSVTDEYGTLTIDPNTGEYTYTLNKDSEAVQKLTGRGDDVTQRVTVVVTDEYGAHAERPLDITIKGANDLPIITDVTEHVKDTGVFGEDAASANSSTRDYTGGEGHIPGGEHRLGFEGQLQGFDHEGTDLTYGVVTSDIAADGELTLTNPDNADETTTLRVLSVSTDEAGTTTIVTEAGTFTLAADGHYSFELNTDAGGFVDAMGQGDKWNLIFDVSASDGELTGTGSLTICIEGTNEAPTFTQMAHKDYLGQEQAPVNAAGTWVVEAAEQGRWRGEGGNSNRVSDHTDVLTGSFAATDRDNGESASLTFGAEFKDGSTGGGNRDALEALGRMELKGEEDLVLTEPRPLAEHADKGTDNYTELAAGTYKVFHFDVGDFYLNVDTGDYYFDVNDDSELVNRMNLGDTHSLNFSVTVTDEHGASSSHDFTVNITGRNDRPELTVEHGISTTDGQTATGNLSDLVDVKDADFGDSHRFFIIANPTMNGNSPGDYEGRKEDFDSNKLDNYDPVTTLEGKYGVLTIHEDGSYEYRLYGPGEGHDDAYNLVKNLPEGATLEDEVFHIAVQDSHGAFDIRELPVTVTGVNDAPVVNGFNVDVKEDGVYTDGRGNVHDTGLMTDADGNPDTSYQGWVGNADHKLTATGNVLTDTTGGGKPIVSDVDQGDKVTVDIRPNSNTGDTDIGFSITNLDPDIPHQLTPKVISNTLSEGIRTIVTNYGTLTLNTVTGEYSFTLSDSALDGGIADMLAQGQKLTLSFILTATDTNGQSAQHIMGVNIQGANDAPSLSIAPDDRLLEVSEKGANSGKDYTNTDSGQAQGADDDYGARLHYSFGNDADGKPITSISDQYGTMHIDPDTGRYWYELNNNSKDTQALEEGQKVDPTNGKGYTVRVTDEHGAYSEQHVEVEITGSNDNPYLVNGSQVNVVEAGVVPGGNTATAGKEQSGIGQSNIKDWEGDDLAYSINEGASDNRNPGSWNGETGTDDQGWLTYKTDIGVFHLDPATGKYYFVLDNDAQTVQELNAGETISRYLEFTVSDGKGGVLNTWVTANIKGTNDRPELTLNRPDMGVAEDGALTASGTVSVTDPDSGGAKGESFTFGITANDMEHTAQGHTPGMSSSMTGDYGTLSIDPRTGEYTYTLNNGSQAVQELRTGETRTETFHVVVKDSQGAFDIKEVTVTIHGQDDAAQLNSTDAQVIQITEDGVNFNTNVDNNASQRAGGTFEVTPVDNPVDENGVSHLVYGFTDADGAFHAGSVDVIQDGKLYGTLTIDAEGHYTFALADNADVNALNAGELLKLTGYDLAVRDDRHADDMVTSQKLDLYIHGTNDRPYFTVDGVVSNEITADGLVENGTAVIHGQLVADDPDAGHNPGDLSFSIEHGGKLVQVVEGKYGVLQLNPDGSYTYTLTHPELLESLNAGQKLSEQDILGQEDFNIRVTDPQNAFTSGKLVIDVTGSADNPVITVSGETAIQEDAGADINHAAQDPAIHGQLGLDHIVDAEDTGRVTWSNDGQIAFADGADGKPLGTLTVNPDGSYTYTLSTNGSALVQAMNDGESKSETFKVQAVIEGGKTIDREITIEIKGTNDKPVLTVGENDESAFIGKVQQDVFEDDGQTSDTDHPGVIFTGTLPKDAMSDVDDQTGLRYMLVGEDGQPVTEIKTDYGTITLSYETAADGTITTHYRYTLDNESSTLDEALQALQNGESLTDGAKVVVVDPHGAVSENSHNITITIDSSMSGGGGSGEGPDHSLVFDDSSVLHGSVSEDGKDISSTDHHVETTIFEGQLEAKWDDGTDAPDRVFGIQGADGQQVQSSAADGDVIHVDGQYGYLIIDPVTGTYTYTLYNGENGQPGRVQSLAAGETVSEDFTLMLNGVVVKNGDGSDAKITIDIYGTNDAPVITGATDASIGETGHDGLTSDMTATGTVTATDIDHALDADGKPSGGTESVTYYFVDQTGNHVTSMSTEYGTIAINPDGTYTFHLDTDKLPQELVQKYPGGIVHLTAGTHLSETFQVVAHDGKDYSEPQDVTVTINGTNYGPEVVAANVTLAVAEDGTLADSGALSDLFHDDEGTNNLIFTASTTENGKDGTVVQGTYGTLQLVNGEYVYTLNNADPAVQGLDADHPGKDTFYITATDEHGKTSTVEITVNVTGENDTPVLSVDKVLSVREGAEENSVSGQAQAYDADTADQADGALRYGLKVPTDADGNPLHHAVLNADGSITNDFGIFRVNQDGTYSFELNNKSDAVRALTSGSLTETSVTLTVTDSQGHETSQTVKVDITGTNTAPDLAITIEPNTEDSPVVENGTDGADSLSGSFTATDVDGTVALTQDENGQWTYTYTLDERAEALGAGEKTTDTFTVTVTDAEGATTEKTVTVHLEGSNDAPVITAQTSDAVANRGSFSFSDVDINDTHSLSILIGNKTYNVALDEAGTSGICEVDGLGTFSLVLQNGVWTYGFAASDAARAGLVAGTVTDHDFHIQVSDGHARVATDSLTVSVTGTNTAPALHNEGHDLSFADAGLHANVADLATDADGDALDIAFPDATDGDVAGIFGTLHFDADTGEYSYTLNTTEDGLHTLAQAIAGGGEVRESFAYTAHDGVNDAVDGSLDIRLTDLPDAHVGTDGADRVGDAMSTHDQLLFGEDGHDLLFGGAGDDMLYGGAGNDYLDGGSGVNHLYGGDGHDILVFNAESGGTYDGGEGIDFLLGVDRGSLDGLLGGDDPAVSNVEVFFTQTPADVNITGMADLAHLGLSVENTADGDKLHLDDSQWTKVEPTPGDSGLPDGFAEYVHHGDGGEDTTIVVQQHILANHNS